MRGATSPEAAPGKPLPRDVDGNSGVRIPMVEQVITVVDVGDINVVGVVPVISPIFRPWVNETDPIALILKARVPANNQEGQSVDAEAMVRPKVTAEPVVRDAVAVVAATLLPSAVVGIPAL
jgi:hypothetical protein